MTLSTIIRKILFPQFSIFLYGFACINKKGFFRILNEILKQYFMWLEWTLDESFSFLDTLFYIDLNNGKDFIYMCFGFGTDILDFTENSIWSFLNANSWNLNLINFP